MLGSCDHGPNGRIDPDLAAWPRKKKNVRTRMKGRTKKSK